MGGNAPIATGNTESLFKRAVAMTADEVRQLARDAAGRLVAAGIRPETLPLLSTTQVSEKYGFLGLRQREVPRDEVRHTPFGWELWRQTTASYVKKAHPVPLVCTVVESIWLRPDGVLARVELEEKRGPIERDSAKHHVAADYELERSDYDWRAEPLDLADGFFYERYEWVSSGIPAARIPFERLRARLVSLAARVKDVR